MMAFVLLAVCIIAETTLELCYKHATSLAPGVMSALRHPLTWLGIGLWLAQAIAWILTLRVLPLAIAFPINCLTYITVPLAGWLVLKERLSRRQMLASLLIFGGVILVAGRLA